MVHFVLLTHALGLTMHYEIKLDACEFVFSIIFPMCVVWFVCIGRFIFKLNGSFHEHIPSWLSACISFVYEYIFKNFYWMQGLCTDELFQRACIFASCWQYMDRCLSSKYDMFLLLSRSFSLILNAECIVYFWHHLIADHFFNNLLWY